MPFIVVIFTIFISLRVFLRFYARHNPFDVTFVAGDIGAGKTTFAAKLARQYNKLGWSVYSNVPIKNCFELNVQDLQKKCCPEYSLVIIDESALEMNSRKYSSLQMGLLAYFKLCRHYKNKCVLFSQTFTDTDKQIRDLSSKILFIRPLIGGRWSMPLRVNGSMSVDSEGQPVKKYNMGRFALPYRIGKYCNDFDTYSAPFRGFVSDEMNIDVDVPFSGQSVHFCLLEDEDSFDDISDFDSDKSLNNLNWNTDVDYFESLTTLE